ncbi:MAG: hypothetical protein WA432_02025 [Candidatus Babeliaceae bacterium]
MKNTGRIVGAFCFLLCNGCMYADVIRALCAKQFEKVRRHNKLLVVYFYKHPLDEERKSAHFKHLQDNLHVFREVSEEDRYEKSGIQFVTVNITQNDLYKIQQKYKVKDTNTIILFYRGSLYSSESLQETEFLQSDIENFIDDHFDAFIKERLNRMRQAMYRPERNTIYEYGRPVVYAGPSWGYYYSPYCCDPYWPRCCWGGGCGFGYGRCYGPSVGFGFSVGV